jgi:TatD DNase family protein
MVNGWGTRPSSSTRTNAEQRIARLIDIGANLTHPAFAEDLDAVLRRAIDGSVERIIATGTDLASSEAAVALCAAHQPHLYCTVGIHPHDAAAAPAAWLERLEILARNRAVRAIGETGLDFNRNYSPQPAQRAVFDAQLALAVRLQLPVFVHDRDSNGAVADALARHRAALRDVVVHCFTGSEADLLRYIDLGCHIGITGWICDERRGSALKQLVARIPDDRLLIETDATFLLPRTMSPRPKNRRNEPAYLIWVARAVAEARGQTVEAVGALTRANARRVFALD